MFADVYNTVLDLFVTFIRHQLIRIKPIRIEAFKVNVKQRGKKSAQKT